jgi:hypothetical protein
MGALLIGLEGRLTPHPVSALLCNGTLGQLVAQLNLEFTATGFVAIDLGNVEFFALFANLVGDLVGDEGW